MTAFHSRSSLHCLPAMYEVHEIKSIDELGIFEAVWHALLRVTDGSRFFMTPQWLTAHWRH